MRAATNSAHMNIESTPFFSALSIEDKDWLNSQERRLREQYAINRVPEKKLEQMMSAEPGSKQIVGLPFFDILDN